MLYTNMNYKYLLHKSDRLNESQLFQLHPVATGISSNLASASKGKNKEV